MPRDVREIDGRSARALILRIRFVSLLRIHRGEVWKAERPTAVERRVSLALPGHFRGSKTISINFLSEKYRNVCHFRRYPAIPRDLREMYGGSARALILLVRFASLPHIRRGEAWGAERANAVVGGSRDRRVVGGGMSRKSDKTEFKS
jgi:hypothetical protein